MLVFQLESFNWGSQDVVKKCFLSSKVGLVKRYLQSIIYDRFGFKELNKLYYLQENVIKVEKKFYRYFNRFLDIIVDKF